MERIRALLTNDDGIAAPGLTALAEALVARVESLELVVVAPAGECSGSGHAFSYKKPLYVREVRRGEAPGYAVEGTPVDCVKVGLFLTSGEVDWVIAGLNRGANVGVDAYYSGTVAAACEGALQGLRGVAFSQQVDSEAGEADLRRGARLAAEIFAQLLRRDLGPGACLNVNLPARPQVRGIWPTAQALQRYRPRFRWESLDGTRALVRERGEVEEEPLGLDGDGDGDRGEDEGEDGVEVDYRKLRQGYVTITPLALDRTERRLLEAMRRWRWIL